MFYILRVINYDFNHNILFYIIWYTYSLVDMYFCVLFLNFYDMYDDMC